ncbi:hypothetical protein OG235_36830 [Streptomyces sp. NBC_00024]|uniref:hypothetical protein n=1 Tax=Streptomyces sp. NBC_00024 TaxID=2903612 RepID=UPI00324CFC33
MDATTNAITTAALIDGYADVAGHRSEWMARGPERDAMRAAARKAWDFVLALHMGEHFTPERFTEITREIDALMANAGAKRLAARTSEWLAAFTA